MNILNLPLQEGRRCIDLHVSDSITQKGTYSIGEVSKMIGSTIKTVRYYDDIGLVKPTSYTEGSIDYIRRKIYGD